MQNRAAWCLLIFSVIVSTLALPPDSPAVTFLSGPTISPTTNAPLAGTLQLTTDVDSRVGVLVSDGTNVWERDFYDFATTHSIPLLGFEPDRTNLILVTVYDKFRSSQMADQLLVFVTEPLPANF